MKPELFVVKCVSSSLYWTHTAWNIYHTYVHCERLQAYFRYLIRFMCVLEYVMITVCQLMRYISPFAVALADLKTGSDQLSNHNKRLRELGDAVQFVRDVIAMNFTAEVSKLTEDVSTYVCVQHACSVCVSVCKYIYMLYSVCTDTCTYMFNSTWHMCYHTYM